MPEPTKVLFVCVSNRGKSVMAERLSPVIGTGIAASSAGTSAQIGGSINDLSAQALTEVGADISGHHPRQLTDDMMRSADVVVVVGPADVHAPAGVEVIVWDIDEPSHRGIDGMERMRLIRDEIIDRIRALPAFT